MCAILELLERNHQPTHRSASIEIVAPWGEPQFGEVDCLLAVTVEDENDSISGDRYIIERKAFEATYKVR
jgi:hypothetical protein